MHRLLLAAAAAAAAAVLTACSTGSHCDKPNIPFVSVPIANVRMVFPAQGATGVPVTGFTMQLFGGNDAYGERLRLIDRSSGTVIAGGPLVAIVPPPAGGPPQPDHTATVPPLSAHTTYDVYVDGAAPVFTTDCPPSTTGGSFGVQAGTFTTM